MFAVHEVTVEADFEVAVARLMHLISRDALHAPSEAAYEGGIASVLRVGPFGGARGFSRLVRVQFLPPVRRGTTMTMPLRWQATGSTGELFPVLDADLILDDGGDRVRLALSGSYRPPFGQAGAAIDRAILRAVASATIRALLENLAGAIADPAPEQLPSTYPVPGFRPVTEYP